MESNFLFRPRVELLFLDGNATTMYETVNNNHKTTIRCSCDDNDDIRNRNMNSKLITKVYFQRNSILFQVSVNAEQKEENYKINKFSTIFV